MYCTPFLHAILLLNRPGRNPRKYISLEKQVYADGRQHHNDDSGCQLLPGPPLGIGIVHQEGGQGAQLVLRHIQIWDVHVIDDINGLDDYHRGRGRRQKREYDPGKQPEVSAAV